MIREIWGTFSVRDHLVERAFVADVLLYDRLVIPTKPENSDPSDWPAKWGLAHQQRLLDVLGELAIPIPWTTDRQQYWQQKFDDAHREGRGQARTEVIGGVATDAANARADDLQFQVTRMVLADYSNAEADDRLFRRLRATGKARPGSELEAVAAYPSFDAFNRDVATAANDAPPQGSFCAPTAIFGWNFFVPASADRGKREDLHLLEKAIRLARRADYIELRGEFYKWLSDISEGGVPPAEARSDMEKRIGEYQKLMEGEEWKKWTRRAVKVADAFAGGLGLVNEVAGTLAEGFLGTADIVIDEREGPPGLVPRLKVAAMFHDAQQKFGWKPLQN